MQRNLLLCLLWITCQAFPDAAISYGGFKPVPIPQARGVPEGHQFPEGPQASLKIKRSGTPYQGGSNSGNGGHQSGKSFGGNNFGAASDPTKTFYVNVPPQNYPPPKPIAAGPPRQHYRIVFIRSPSPPPPQPILPPKTEQKTIIYVLHPKKDNQQQKIIEVPNVAHDPQVYFVQYDGKPPAIDDLQDLVKNTIETGGNPAIGGIGGIGGANYNFGGLPSQGSRSPSSASSFSGAPSPVSSFSGAPAPANVYAPGSQESFVNKRGTSNSKTSRSSTRISNPTRPLNPKRRITPNRKQPPFVRRTSVRKSAPAPSSSFRNSQKKKLPRSHGGPVAENVKPSADFQDAFKSSFGFPAFSFVGQTQNKREPKTKTKAVQKSS